MVAADGIAPKELSSLSFSLGNIRPEGITQGKESGEFFIANLAFGGVRRLDIATGRLATVVPDQPYWERGAVGLAYALGMLVVSGGGSVFGWPGSVTVYDAETGVELASCLPSGDPARLLNGVAVVNDTAYITDSQRSVLMRLDINGARNGECITSSVPLIVVDYNNNNVDLFSTNEANVLLADGKCI